MVKKILLIFIFISFNLLRGQDEDITYGILPSDVPTSNLIKYNRFYFNPTFSLVRENKKSINAYTKMQWASFNDNPQTFLLNYTSNFDERIGVSIGLHQQNEGIYNYFGGIANFAYGIELNRDMNFTFGVNLGFSQSGLKPNIDSTENMFQNNNVTIDDPIIFNYQNSSVFQLSPGVNFNYQEFDAGISVTNLVAYNLTSSALLTDKMAFTGHVMYTTSLERRSDKTVRGMAYANMLPDAGSGTILRYGANGIVELPELGWGQVGYNSFYGISLGIGGYISSGVSIGYTYEMGFGDTSEFGGSHEVGIAYNFETEEPRRRSKAKTGTQKAYEARDSEIRRLKREILDQNKIIRELQDQTGELKSREQRAMSELERSIAEAKEKESQALRDLELQREEEVKLLNKKKAEEEERLRSQQRLEAEMSEIKLEEERLAAEKRLEVEMAEQKLEEERLAAERRLEQELAETERREEEQRIANEEAEREAEAAREQEIEEERIAVEEAEREAEAARQEQVEQERIANEEAEREVEREAEREAEAARQEQVEQERIAAEEAEREAEAERKAEEQRLAAQKKVEEQQAIQKAEEERLAAERRLEMEMAEQRAEEERLASQKRLEVEMAEQKAEEERLASQKRLEVEMATQANEEAEKEAEAARLAEEERLRQEAAAEAARLAEEERLRQEAAAEAARLAEEERLRQEAAAEAARLAEEERLRQEAAANQPDEDGLDEIKKELDNNSRVSNKILARRDSLLTTGLNVDKREFSKMLESLVNMNDDADAAKKETDPVSSKRLTANNRFVKFAETTRPEAQIATKYIPGYEEGYYLIGNVFKGGTYADKFTGTLKDLGFADSQIIVNPENQFQYVSIESYSNKNEAIEKYTSSIDNRYFGDMWILHIAQSRVASYKRLLQETKLITDTVKDDTVLSETLSYIGGHNIQNGYYLITNIFKRENYFERGMEKLRSQGLEPQSFRNPKDNYIYVYLKRYDNLDDAKQGLFSNVNNSYDGDLYILKIQ